MKRYDRNEAASVSYRFCAHYELKNSFDLQRGGSTTLSVYKTSSMSWYPGINLCHGTKSNLRPSHPNLPQMVGFSDESTPAPFVVLAKGDHFPVTPTHLETHWLTSGIHSKTSKSQCLCLEQTPEGKHS